ncbi:XRE family transcriptional regulator [Actinomadura sp. DC4]|uniref:XRE family transcriptional regulator n=1 Tax=Actinomadura sp. DC4 TaxID=3055069 RepID=UPI00339D9EDC
MERWIAGRVPYPRHRGSLADLLDVDEYELWPCLAQRQTQPTQEAVQIQAAYAHRWAVPRKVWVQLFGSAEREIGILAYAALFLAEDDGILRILADKARTGVRVRILLGEPDSRHVIERGSDEGVADAIAAKIRNSLTLYGSLAKIDTAEIRLHSTTLYASIYRADDDLLVNMHAYGATASHAPVIHVRHTTPGDMADTYMASFEQVWRGADEQP